MKKKVIGIAALLAAAAAIFFAYRVFSAKSSASNAVEAYNAAVREYNAAIAPFNEAASGIAEANNTLQGVLDAAQAVLDKGEKAYEPDTQDELESAVKKAGKAFAEVPVQIDPLEEQALPVSFSTKELELAQHEAETALQAVEEAKGKIPETPEVPDYAKELEAVQTAQKKYEDSVQKLANITAPSDSFVRERIERIGTVVEAEAVTAEHDPNGLLGQNGGYIGCVYFLDERVDRNLLPQEAFEKEKEKSEASQTASTESAAAEETADTGKTAAAEETADTGETAAAEVTAGAGETVAAEGIAASGETAAAAATEAAAQPAKPKENTIDVVMIGTAGGGAVEVFATEEEAKNRAEYISFFDGSVMEAGPCEVEGTCVIRASKYLEEEEQKKLIKEVREALLAVEE